MLRQTTLALLILISILLTACAPAATQDPIAIAQAYLDALWAHDFDTAASYLANDAIAVDYFRTTPVEGKAAIVEFWSSSANPINGTIETSNPHLDGNWVIYDFVITQGEAMGRRGTSSSSTAGVIVVENGKVTFDGDQSTALLWAN